MGLTLRQHGGVVTQANALSPPTDHWYESFTAYSPNSPYPANRLKVRSNACIQGSRVEMQKISKPESEVLEEHFTVSDIPENYNGDIVKGTVLISTVTHFHTLKYDNLAHMAGSAFAVFDALEELSDHTGKKSPINVTAVLMHQASSDDQAMQRTDWYKKVALLSAHANHGQPLQFMDSKDVATGICAEQFLIYDRPYRTDKKVHERHFFTDPLHAQAFQEHAIDALHLPEDLKASTRKLGRVVNLVIRTDLQGYQNIDEVTEKLGQYLKQRCWTLSTWSPNSETAPLSLDKQVEAFARSDLSISVHGAHLTNVVWQGKDTGVVVIDKCGHTDSGTSSLSSQMGILTYHAGKCVRKQPNPAKLLLQLGESLGDPPHIHDPLVLDFDIDLKPVLDMAIHDLDNASRRGPPPENCQA